MENCPFAELRPPSVHLVSLHPSLTVCPDRGTRDEERVKGHRGEALPRVGSPTVSFGALTRLKCDKRREVRREREEEREIVFGGTNRCPRKSGCPEPGCRRVNIISPLYGGGYDARYAPRGGITRAYTRKYAHVHGGL